ncbi:hypothetical protein [Halomonas sp. NO4]|uniref:hypothetical protein n=1 Tax=Halomonas sp. NO4 TaxID=2484813 RepID=UPI0013D6972C|nr:hypothetical protein [Halomonas sp. NO4]
MGGSSRSSTRRTYNTTNVSQQGEGNVHGNNNRVTIERADALALEHIADVLGAGVQDVTEAGEEQTRRTLDATVSINRDSLDSMENVSGDAINLAREVAQAGEEGSQRAMDFVANYTERAQTGNAAEATRTVMWVAAVAGVTLVGIAWASKGGIKA